MYSTKLFFIFGILLIVMLGQSEGRPRWLHRKGHKRSSCAAEENLNLTSGVIDKVDLSQQQNNGTQIYNRNSSKRCVFKCGRAKCDQENVISMESELNANQTKELLRTSPEIIVDRRHWTHNKFGSFKVVNVKRNEEGYGLKGSQKYKGRTARRKKFQKSKTQSHLNENDREELKKSNENILDTEKLAANEEPKEVKTKSEHGM